MLEACRDVLEACGRAIVDMNSYDLSFVDSEGKILNLFELKPFKNVTFYKAFNYCPEPGVWNGWDMIIFGKNADFGAYELVDLKLDPDTLKPNNKSIYRMVK